jgi:hypothetical protein
VIAKQDGSTSPVAYINTVFPLSGQATKSFSINTVFTLSNKWFLANPKCKWAYQYQLDVARELSSASSLEREYMI